MPLHDPNTYAYIMFCFKPTSGFVLAHGADGVLYSVVSAGIEAASSPLYARSVHSRKVFLVDVEGLE